MTYKKIMNQLNIIEDEVDLIEKEIISQLNLLNNDNFINSRERLIFNHTEMKLLKLKKNIDNVKINPLKYNKVIDLLAIYPYYSLNIKQKEIIDRNIENIKKTNNLKLISQLFFYCFMEKKEKEMLSSFSILAKKEDIESLLIMKNYFIFNNKPKSYSKVTRIIKKIK